MPTQTDEYPLVLELAVGTTHEPATSLTELAAVETAYPDQFELTLAMGVFRLDFAVSAGVERELSSASAIRAFFVDTVSVRLPLPPTKFVSPE